MSSAQDPRTKKIQFFPHQRLRKSSCEARRGNEGWAHQTRIELDVSGRARRRRRRQLLSQDQERRRARQEKARWCASQHDHRGSGIAFGVACTPRPPKIGMRDNLASTSQCGAQRMHWCSSTATLSTRATLNLPAACELLLPPHQKNRFVHL